MAYDPAHLPDAIEAFLGERHLATLTTLRPAGTPHVVPVGFTWDRDEQLVRIITFAPSRKARNVIEQPGNPAVVCQFDGGRWLSLEGTATVTTDPARVADAIRRYTERYREPSPSDERVAIEIAVTQILGRA